MNDKEKRIKEQRVAEANREDLVGLEGKFGCILRNLGEKILASNYGGITESNEMEDVWQIGMEDEEEILTANPEDNTEMIGYMFSGLSNGIHMDMKYILESKLLSVHYKGLLVYLEEENDIKSFIPSEEWQSKINQLYKLAKVREKKRRQKIAKEEEMEAIRNKKDFLKEMFKKWGFK